MSKQFPSRNTLLKPEPPRPIRIESSVTGTITSASKKNTSEFEFILQDNSQKKEFRFRLSNRAAISEKTIDIKKDIITITTSSGSDRFSLIKVGASATVTTLDPIDSIIPLQALTVTINPSPSK